MTMNGSTGPITFTVYSALGRYNVPLLVCVLVLYVSGLCINLLLVVVVCAESRLHRPVYVLLLNLAVSGVVGSSSVCPNMVSQLMASRNEMSLAACLVQVFLTNVYGGCIFCILALMAYDRYVSICKPLRYHSIMTPARIKLMLAAVYLALSLVSAVQVYLISSLTLCRRSVDKLLCDSLLVANLSCGSITVISVYGLCCAVAFILLPLSMVALSYFHIFTVIVKTSRDSRRKALHTCTPHLVTFINFSVASFFGVIYNRLTVGVPAAVNVFTCLSFFVIPPVLHPIVYGIKMREIRQSINKVVTEKILQL